MRYSFHGKVRATGQQVDGYVEANSSTEAIDRLADQGIIGVHTVRPEAKKQRNAVILGTADVYEDEPPKALPAAATMVAAPAPVAPQPIYIPVPTPAAGGGGEKTEQILGQLVEKLTTLMGHVETLLSRPSQIVYQSGPARNGGGGGAGGGTKRSPRQGNDAQDKTLMAIFQTNMDLRKSLNKLSTVVTNGVTTAAPATNGSPVAAAVSAPAGNAGNGSPAASSTAPSRMEPSRSDSGSKSSAGNGRERVLKPQPAA